MTARQIRRAAERSQKKLERKAANGFVFSSGSRTPEPPTQTQERSDACDISPARLAANGVAGASTPDNSEKFAGRARAVAGPVSAAKMAANVANSHLSTGPKTSAGKAHSAMNAVKTGLTGRTVLLPTDDAMAYEKHLRDFEQEFRPVGIREQALVQSLADTAWRLNRIPALEMAIYAKGRVQFAEQFENDDPALRPGLIDLETYLAYEKQLRNLHIQETRLRRQREKDTAELHQLQRERLEPPAHVAAASVTDRHVPHLEFGRSLTETGSGTPEDDRFACNPALDPAPFASLKPDAAVAVT